jgi:hypothetical protein
MSKNRPGYPGNLEIGFSLQGCARFSSQYDERPYSERWYVPTVVHTPRFYSTVKLDPDMND